VVLAAHLHILLHLACRYGTTLRKYANRTTDRIVTPVLMPGGARGMELALAVVHDCSMKEAGCECDGDNHGVNFA